jgi:alkanesulfonate monooxygenase SsuD/methylene tetrahydromethanopterin reductase-like flavin-dependent oxidoreductase (luciferase family)
MNFGSDANIEHPCRHERSVEFLDVTKALWDSFEDDSFLLDKKSSFFADPKPVRRMKHVGKCFKV